MRPELSGVLTRSRGDFDDILERSDLIVELIGGIEPAREYILRAIEAGKHVVTANKQVLSQHGEEIYEAARTAGVQLRFEAAVGGVVPGIRVIHETLAAAHIDRVHGIVNGTTNFILTAMAATGASYEEALERGPGARLRRGRPDRGRERQGRRGEDGDPGAAGVPRAGAPRRGQYEGIKRVTAEDIEYAKELGLSLKLIGTAERRDGGIRCACTRPSCTRAIRSRRSTAPFNAVTIESPAITEITLSGPGRRRDRRPRRAVLGDVISAMIPPPTLPPPATDIPLVHRHRVGVLPVRRGGRPARACWRASPRSSGCRACRSGRWCRRGWARTRGS